MTFASFWTETATELGPGDKYSSNERYQNVLAFYVPLSGETATLPGETALALMEGRRVVVACPYERWGPRVAAEEV